MKVRFIRPHPTYAYYPGDEVTLSDKEAKGLLEYGFCVPVGSAKPETATAKPTAEQATKPRK